MSDKINIPESVTKKCSLKCNLFYNYSDSPNLTIAKNKNISASASSDNYAYLTVTYNDFNASTNNILYNSVAYKVSNMYLFNGGIHKFSGTSSSTPDMEIVIKHTAITSSGSTNSSNLYICIPVYSTASTTSTNVVDKLIKRDKDLFSSALYTMYV